MGLLTKLSPKLKWSEKVKDSKVSEKPVEKDMPEKITEPLLMVSPSQLSEDSVEEVVSRESPLSSMMTPEPFSDLSLNKLSEMLSHTLSMLEEKLSPLWMLSTPSKDKVELSTVSETDLDFFVNAFYIS